VIGLWPTKRKIAARAVTRETGALSRPLAKKEIQKKGKTGGADEEARKGVLILGACNFNVDMSA